MEIHYILIIVFVTIAHIAFAGFSTVQVLNEVISMPERLGLIFLVWLVPFFGAHTANLKMNPKWTASTVVTDREAGLMSSSDSSSGGCD